MITIDRLPTPDDLPTPEEKREAFNQQMKDAMIAEEAQATGLSPEEVKRPLYGFSGCESLYSRKGLVLTRRVLNMLIDSMKNRKSEIVLFAQKGFRRQYHPSLPDLTAR